MKDYAEVDLEGFPRPLEVHAHDPLHYVGDMLGWLHQALSSERELIAALLDPEAINDSGPANRRHSVRRDSSKGEFDITSLAFLKLLMWNVYYPPHYLKSLYTMNVDCVTEF
ncbi:hypothetical protein QYE76_020889 [Lolium multiflorum]|uniref:Conserved Oligomeric Golgi complex subunit 6 C-terminal domain-containing protein n=1 Tax=Lolium multiflorum TaxID=4521 RepID=A0AAD8R7Z0_LOLMU|nr:hypothetical protein QYE76_020889 [Lolium multiflorum]